MWLKSLRLQGFRNYREASFEFPRGINLILGENGAGKTNILEAIFLLSTGRSFRTAQISELIMRGASHFHIEGHFESNGVEQVLKIGYDGKSRKVSHNATPFSSFSHILGILPSVIFSPRDISLITGAPLERRRFLNIQLAQSDPLYVHHLTRYHRALKHRNSLLKAKTDSALSPWEQIMADSGTYLRSKREELSHALGPKLGEHSSYLSGEKEAFNIIYRPSIKENLSEALLRNRKRDLLCRARWGDADLCA